jgi:PAS domain S-box-containing protein
VTIRTRTLTALGLTFLALTAALPLITSSILTTRFRVIEQDEALRNVSRVQDAVHNELDQLENVVEDWASWDDTWRFVQGRDGRYLEDNLPDSTLASLDLDVMAFYDTRGRLRFGGVRTSTGDVAPPDAATGAGLYRIASARLASDARDGTAGVVALPDGAWLVAVAPVLRSDGSGAPAGEVVFGQRLDEARVRDIGRLTHLSLEVLPYGDALRVLGADGVPREGQVRLGPPEDDVLPAWTTLGGLGPRPGATVAIRLDRGTHQVGLETRRYVVGVLLAGCALFTLVAGLSVERGVLRRLASLTDAVSRLGVTGGRLVVTGGDELSTLAGRINHTLEEMERAEAARTSSDRRLALALEAANDGWFDWDLVGRDVYYSPRWCTMLGFAPGEIEGTGSAAMLLLHPDDLHTVRMRLRTHLAGSSPAFESEVRMRTSTGEWKWIQVRGRVVERDVTGRAVRMVGTQTDISERKRMEARLVMADRLASVGTLAAGVAHEINNPLAYVMTNLEVALIDLETLPDLGHVREALEEAAEGAGRVRDIVRDMKLFARDQVEATAVDLRRVLDATLRMTAHEVRPRARLTDEVGELPLVTGTDARLGQVIVNLVLNAVQAMPEGRPTDQNEIRVRARRNSVGDVVLEVRDNGVGMDAATQRRIFDPFFTTKPVGVGTGLGLYVCHNLVAAYGGRLEVVSAPGEGTTFKVVLPVWRTIPMIVIPPLSLTDRRPRVLIVDDEPAVPTAVRRLLGADCEVVGASSGAAALEALASDAAFDVVMCDLVMPGMDGAAFHATLRELHPGLVDRLVFTSGGPPHAEVQAFLDRVLIPRLEKPFSPEALRGLVRGERSAA